VHKQVSYMNAVEQQCLDEFAYQLPKGAKIIFCLKIKQRLNSYLIYDSILDSSFLRHSDTLIGLTRLLEFKRQPMGTNETKYSMPHTQENPTGRSCVTNPAFIGHSSRNKEI
jgi:hypothetical protein